jgi:hypothetical protein
VTCLKGIKLLRNVMDFHSFGVLKEAEPEAQRGKRV